MSHNFHFGDLLSEEKSENLDQYLNWEKLDLDLDFLSLNKNLILLSLDLDLIFLLNLDLDPY